MITEPDTRAYHNEFEREERYVVFKRKHLSEDACSAVLALADCFGAEVTNCVVVEEDWPEYETVWELIEARTLAKGKEL